MTNDTGPRHYAVAFGKPVVVMMGPTDPRHTNCHLEQTIILREDLPCVPCHKKVCPIDHPCMIEMTPDKVFHSVQQILDQGGIGEYVHRVLIIGARRRKQGLGEFIARCFHEQGAEICGIVGTSSQSVDNAAEHLHLQYGISTQGYTDLKTAIEQAKPTIVVIASPTDVHHQHLKTVAAFGISCLCEKPLFWNEGQPVESE